MLDILSCSIGSLTWDNNTIVIPTITVLVVTLIKIAIPIILIIMGMIDLSKAVISNDEKEMKGAQTKLIKRVIYAILVFLVISIVQLIFSTIATSATDGAGDNIAGCIACFTTSAESCK